MWVCAFKLQFEDLKIEAFRIKHGGRHKNDLGHDQVRLISSPQDFAASSALTAYSDSDNEVNDANDLEVLIH